MPLDVLGRTRATLMHATSSQSPWAGRLLERVGTGIVGTIGYVVLPTGVSTDVSRDIV